MPNVILDEQILIDIAAEIRAWNGTSTKYTPSQMANAIKNINTTGTRVAVQKKTSTKKVILNEQYLKDIANAIRTRRGGTRQYYPGEMAWAIRHLDVKDGDTPVDPTPIDPTPGPIDPTNIPSFASATEDELVEIVGMMDRGEITSEQTGWEIGDERIVHLNAIPYRQYIKEEYTERDITLVIMDSGHYTLTTGGKDHFVVGLKDGSGFYSSMGTYGYIEENDDEWRGWSWCGLRKWCNEDFRNAFPEKIRSIFKQFTSACLNNNPERRNVLSLIDEDYFSLFAVKEILGEGQDENPENAYLTQIAYFKEDIINRLGIFDKWTRSLDVNDPSFFRCTYASGGMVYSRRANYIGNDLAIQPFGCI